MLVFFIFLVIVSTPWFRSFSLPLNLFSINIPQEINEAKVLVDYQRGKISQIPINSIFLNWPSKIFYDRMGIVFENLDIGNYFFAGHPRERVGLIEKQKFQIFHLVLLIFGLFAKEMKKFAKFLIIYTTIILVLTFIFKWRDFNQTIFFSIPLILTMALGAKNVFTSLWIRLR